jgi:poly(glycerol-phosphate) alpha-glucosyltransferase
VADVTGVDESTVAGSRVAIFPSGRYLSASGIVRANTGGQTRAMLMRSRVIGAATGRPVDVLCFDPSSRYDAIRAELHGQGLLAPDMRLLNIFEHYRDVGWGEAVGSGEQLERLDGMDIEEVQHPDGTPWQTSYLDPLSGKPVMNDFRRRDGSVYLRVAPYRTLSAEALPRSLIMVGPDGDVVGRFAGLRPWYHRWLHELTSDDEQTFLFIDSRFLLPIVAPVEDRSIRLIYVLHNCHVPAPRRWDTPSRPAYRRSLEKIEDVDAFVTLTQRQRSDIELRWGSRNNMAVVANPVERPKPPIPLPERDRYQVVVVARLEKQKRVEHAIEVMAMVAAEIPEARLDIYGSGSRKTELQQLIDRRGLGRNVTLRGYDPDAAQALWTASVFLLTSEFEGYPLSVLESLSRGCPVVCYDVAYGPREQITDGVDGFLVADGDKTAAAQRVVRLLSAPDLVTRMGADGQAKARLHEQDGFLTDWASVVGSVVKRAPNRTRLISVELTTEVTSTNWLSRLRGRRVLTLAGRLLIRARTEANPKTLGVSLQAVGDATGEVAWLDITTEQINQPPSQKPEASSNDTLTEINLGSVIDLHQVFAIMPKASRATFRLAVSWQNAHWETTISPRKQLAGPAATATGPLSVRRPSRHRS